MFGRLRKLLSSDYSSEPDETQADLRNDISMILSDSSENVPVASRDPYRVSSLPIAREPELIKMRDFLYQYKECLNTLKCYGFLAENGEVKEGDIQSPSFEKAMGTFKAEELKIASSFQKPVLLIIPETSFDAKVKALDAHRQGLQKSPTYVSKEFIDSDSGSERITGWRAIIVDGIQRAEVYEGDQRDLRINDRIKARKDARRKGEKGMDRHRYALLMMVTIRNGNPVDDTDTGSYTLLDDDPALSDTSIPYGVFYRNVHHEIANSRFECSYPVHFSDYARYRSSVGGDILIR